MIKFTEIIEGWRNHFVPHAHLKDLIKEVSDHRLAICSTCPNQSENANYSGIRKDLNCIKCGCPLAAKTKSLSSKCPIDKWEALVCDEERYKIEQQIKNENNATLQQGDPENS